MLLRDRILAARRASWRTKRRALKYLYRLGYWDAEQALVRLFVWQETPQGDRFWRNLALEVDRDVYRRRV